MSDPRLDVRQLRQLLEMMRVAVIPQELAITRANEAFDSTGQLARMEDIEGLRLLAEGLAMELAHKQQSAA